MKIFMIAGEPSGDVIGADLIRGLQAQAKGPVSIIGIGGPLMEAAGMKILLPMQTLSVMGLTEVIARFPHLHKIYTGLIAEIRKQRPDALVTIDFPDFNFMVSRAASKIGGIKRIHYVAPTVWAWRPGRAKKIAQFLNGLICLYPFEPPYFKKHKLKAIYAGHPLAEVKMDAINPVKFRESLEIPANARTLGLFFGSRAHELERLSPVIKEAALIVLEKYPNTHVIIPTLPHLEFEIRNLMAGFGGTYHVISDPHVKWETFTACDAAIAVSGTVGLELAWMNVPHVIAYKLSTLSGHVAKVLLKTKYVHIANVLLQGPVIPEFLQKNCDAEKIAQAILKFYEDPASVEAQREKFALVREKMLAGLEEPPSHKAARFIYHLINAQRIKIKPKQAEEEISSASS